MAEYRYKLLYLVGPEAPVLLLIWLLYMTSLWPLALMEQWKLWAIATPMSIGLGITFVSFSRGHGKSWMVMSYLALIGSIVGTAQGFYLRFSYPLSDENLPLNYPKVLLQAVFIPAGALLLLLLVVGALMRRCGCRIVGSSKEYDKNMASHIIFGTAIAKNVEQLATGSEHLLGYDDKINEVELHEEHMLVKLQEDLYFSGEPIYDYAFWLANNHLMLGLIFHHPLSPMDTGHRFVILITTSLMIVFPVALVTVLWPILLPKFPGQGIVRLIFMAIIVILPRNIMKQRVKDMTIRDEEIYTEMRAMRGSKADVRQIKKQLMRKEGVVYGAIGLITVLFCWATWHLVDKQSDEEPIILVLENTDGLGFCFILEILFALIMPKPSKNEEGRCLGWWGRWRSERKWHLSLDVDAEQGLDMTSDAEHHLSPRVETQELQDPEAAWKNFNGYVFEPALEVHKTHGDSPVRLIDARFLVELEIAGGKLCRRQDLPESAFIDLEELKQLPPHKDAAHNSDLSLRIIVVSHPWLQLDDPDPEGLGLKILALLCNILLDAGGYTYAVFIDFLSLLQPGATGRRTLAEEQLYDLAMKDVLDWFACPWTLTVQLTNVPTGYPGYLERGWCFAEDAVSSLVKDSRLVMDLGKLTGNAMNFREMLAECPSDRWPPIAPQRFKAVLSTKSFLKPYGDQAKLAELYRRTFEKFMGAVEKLDFKSVGWGDEETLLLAEACNTGALQSLTDLRLHRNQIGDDGCKALARAWANGALPKLTRLCLCSNKIGNPGCKAIAGAGSVGALPELEELCLFKNEIGDDGCAALAAACTGGALSNLEKLCLERNQISRAGKMAFKEAKATGALPKCVPKI